MMRWVAVLLLVCCFTLATVLDPAVTRIRGQSHSAETGGVLAVLMGDSRRLFANEFFAKADAYFHSGFYPTIFDKGATDEPAHISEEAHKSQEERAKPEHEEGEGTFLGPPRDWIERFGRHFYPTQHTHLHGGNEREILPWLKLSAEMDPQRIDTYVVAAYWLRTSLNKPDEAEKFLREGLRANPDSYEILLELGRVYYYNRKDARMARNIWSLALDKWRRQEAADLKPDPHAYEQTLGEMVRADRDLGDPAQLLGDLQQLLPVSHNKETIQGYIDEAKAKMARPEQ
ncbi:MAG: hypothetical protein ABSG59_07020 [Verrucomicrobiota bacterium]